MISTRNDTKLQLEIYFHSVTDFLLGLEAKKARVIISEQEIEGAAYIFYQKTINRLKNIMHLNVKEESNWLSKIRSKKRILKVLFKQ